MRAEVICRFGGVVQTPRIQARMNCFHLAVGHEKATAPHRVARFRSCWTALEFPEGRSRTRRHADRDQPSDPAARTLLWTLALPSATTPNDHDGYGRAPFSRY